MKGDGKQVDELTATQGAETLLNGFTSAELRRAAVQVCGLSSDVAEAREFLGMLGLLQELE